MLPSLFLHHHITENSNPGDLSDIVDLGKKGVGAGGGTVFYFSVAVELHLRKD